MFVSQARTGEAFTPFIDWALRHRLRWRHRRERARIAGIHRHCNFDQAGWVFTAQSVRIFIAPQISTIFIAHQMNSVFLWSICLFTQFIRNQHVRIFYFVKSM